MLSTFKCTFLAVQRRATAVVTGVVPLIRSISNVRTCTVTVATVETDRANAAGPNGFSRAKDSPFEYSLNEESAASIESSIFEQSPQLTTAQESSDANRLEIYRRFRNIRHIIENLGSNYTERYSPYSQSKNIPDLANLTLNDLLAAQCHLGHSKSLMNPAFKRFIFGERDGIHIISLPQTLIHLTRAANIVRDIRRRNGIVVFVSNKKIFKDVVVDAAGRCRGYHVFDRWIPGILTNSQMTLKANGRGPLRKYENGRLVDTVLGGENGAPTSLKPDIVIFLNPRDMIAGVRECVSLRIPTIGIVDTDCDPTDVTYPIPANDDSVRSVRMIADVISKFAAEDLDLSVHEQVSNQSEHPGQSERLLSA